MSKEEAHAFRAAKLAEYGIVLTPEQQNGMQYVEGEFNDYTNRRRVMGPLAAFCHLCDVTSARIWFDCPMAENDPWYGADRHRSEPRSTGCGSPTPVGTMFSCPGRPARVWIARNEAPSGENCWGLPPPSTTADEPSVGRMQTDPSEPPPSPLS